MPIPVGWCGPVMSRAMCMQCVAQSTPMVATSLVVLRRRSLIAFLKASFGHPLALVRRA
jgi:hypothetical protein